ncbi:MAG: hypothetical protein FWE95_05185 [Planctomycetaceae bacterium]|nr:hypothetical protein [Planctomycetaceae bacterium]
MMKQTLRTNFTVPLLFFALLPCVALGQPFFESVRETIDGRERSVQVATFEVTPAVPQEPALRYKLTWGYDQRTATNAAVHYNFASRELVQYNQNRLRGLAGDQQRDFDRVLEDPEIYAERRTARDAFEQELAVLTDDSPRSAEQLRREKSLDYQVYEYSYYCSFPRDKFPMEKAKEFVRGFQNAYRHLELGSRCDYCDWQHPIRGNENPIAILLPEIQEARDLARALQVKARVEIYEGDYDAAIKTIRVGKYLAKHVASEPIIVSVLVGIAIDGIMDATLAELIRQPDAPNLYWTLSAQPSLTGAMGNAMEMEMDMLRAMLPGLAKAMDAPDELSDADWKKLNDRTTEIIPWFTNFSDNIERNLSVEAMIRLTNLVSYPRAKQWLIDQGKQPEEVESMSSVKVTWLWSIERYKVLRDGMLKLVTLPPSQRKVRLEEWELKLQEHHNNYRTATPLDMSVSLLFPAVQAAFNADARHEMNADALRIVEAIRLYAAENDGKLPAKLDDIVSVPIPNVDPFTGKPYDYKIQDDAAVIEVNLGYGYQRFVVRIK